MNEEKKARIIDECLDAVLQNRLTEENCLERYPELKEDLKAVFLASRIMQEFSGPQFSTQQKSLQKNKLMFKLANRDEIVTKSPLFRYRLQNIKRRFGMTWVIIVTTILSLISGAGVVYASNTALPGEMLYPVKTWVEEVQLTLSPDAVDINLLKNFADHRVEELVALDEAGELTNIDGLLVNYQNQTMLMTALMARVEAKNPDVAIRLRAEVSNQLQEHARIIEGYLQIYGEGDPLHERLRIMLQTNTQTRLRINEEPVIVEHVDQSKIEPEISGESAVLPESESGFQNQNQNRVVNLPDEFLQDGALKFQFRFDQNLVGDVYAEVAGKFYDCLVEGALVTCDLTGVSGTGKLNLYQNDSNLLLYSFDYDHDFSYLWKGTKESGGSQTQEQGNPDNGNGSSENGQKGMK
jgi:hypothetical protein